ncbi:YkgJ family cysteine cluster protein [Zobellella maritima]|uniref:YkgJ family cysteine cluster protein n=1 Tax=Zobellella maritima TaxID=2059725 RepID=UPI000E306F1D|nr:YkgJ family cysteine cluster protein [Zobellella maritima]
MSGGNPCLTCGACCAFFRVSFYWGEIHSDYQVPEALTEPVNHTRLAMQGSNHPRPRCVALEGTVGDCVSCSIYPNRPSPCRQFEANDADGACNRARAAYGLPPLDSEPAAA